MTKEKTVAIIGGGITGASAAQTLAKYDNITIHLFDQGRRGVGGRTSSRSAASSMNSETPMRWDHGCQFFRADTSQFKDIIQEWISKGIVHEWKGSFVSSKSLQPGENVVFIRHACVHSFTQCNQTFNQTIR